MIEGSRGGRTGLARAASLAAISTGIGLALPLAASAAGHGSLELKPDGPILIGLILLFLVLILPVNVLLFKPIFRVLDEREQRIAGTRARAGQIERQAADALARYEASVRAVREEAELERRSLLDAARSEGLAATGGARAQVEHELEIARQNIHAALDAARATLRSEAEELAREAASRVLGRAL